MGQVNSKGELECPCFLRDKDELEASYKDMEGGLTPRM